MGIVIAPSIFRQCDWGYCDDPAAGFRFDEEGHGWLPVCQAHLDEGKRVGDQTAPLSAAPPEVPL